METSDLLEFLEEQIAHLQQTIKVVKEKGKNLVHPEHVQLRELLVERLEKQRKEFKDALEKLKPYLQK